MAGSVYAASDDWYLYNSSGKIHDFSVRFPTDWKVQDLSDSKQGFSPSDNYDAPLYLIQEFSAKSFDQVIAYYSDEGGNVLSTEDFLFQSSAEDLIAKKVVYDQLTLKMIKRGTVIFAFTQQSANFTSTFDQIFNSFQFNDNWHQYIDLGESYSFIFPKKMDLSTTSQGVEIIDGGKTIFTVEIDENGQFSNNGKNYQLSTGGTNPSLTEIVESFEFFNIPTLESGYSSYSYFPDVRDKHPNSTAINNLVKSKVINGYADHTFRPDGQINRAELTKMVVATRITPDPKKYANCFSDVQDQWFAKYICYAKNRGWVSGYSDGSFKPESSINRVEAIKIMIEALANADLDGITLKDKSISDIDSKAWYLPYYAYASNNNLLDKQHVTDKKYLPGESIARKEVAESIYRIQQMP